MLIANNQPTSISYKGLKSWINKGTNMGSDGYEHYWSPHLRREVTCPKGTFKKAVITSFALASPLFFAIGYLAFNSCKDSNKQKNNNEIQIQNKQIKVYSENGDLIELNPKQMNDIQNIISNE